jgi:hypothetical protein
LAPYLAGNKTIFLTGVQTSAARLSITLPVPAGHFRPKRKGDPACRLKKISSRDEKCLAVGVVPAIVVRNPEIHRDDIRANGYGTSYN